MPTAGTLDAGRERDWRRTRSSRRCGGDAARERRLPGAQEISLKSRMRCSRIQCHDDPSPAARNAAPGSPADLARGGHPRGPTGRQDDPGPAIARTWPGGATFFDLEDPRGPGPAPDPMLALSPSPGAGRARRGPAPARPVPGAPRAGRPPAHPCALPRARQRMPRTAAAVLGIAGRAHRLPRAAGLLAGEAGATLATDCGSGAAFRLRYLARSEDRQLDRGVAIRPHVPRAGPPPARVQIPSATLARFWAMLAHYHGQVWNSRRVRPLVRRRRT